MPASSEAFNQPVMTTPSSILRFGVIADPQYADIEPNLTLDRHYRQSLVKLGEAIATFNGRELDFVMTLGDIIDRNWESFDDIMPVYDGLKHPARFLLGNHDFAVAKEHLGDVAARIGMPHRYHDFAIGRWRFVVLDGSDVSVFSTPDGAPRHEAATERLCALQVAGAINAQTWNGSLGDEQVAWLEDVMDAAEDAGEQVIVLGHYPVFPANSHNMWDSERLVDLLTSYACFRGYLCGHNHVGNFGEVAGRPFVTFKGMVDMIDENTFAIVSLFEDRIEIEGFGREDSRVLPFVGVHARSAAE